MLLLTRELVEKAIDSVCDVSREKPQQLRANHDCHVVSRIMDWHFILETLGEQCFDGDDYMNAKTPWHFGIEIRQVACTETKIVGIVTFYIAYSSWSGRILYVDRLKCEALSDEKEMLLLRLLSDIALELDCARLTWRHTSTPEWHSQGTNRPEMHGEVLTLSMNQEAMINFVGDSPIEDTLPISGAAFSKDLVCTAFARCLEMANNQNDSCFRLRLAKIEDLDTITSLVKGLAEYVNEPNAIAVSAADYRKDGFDLDDPLWYCLLIDKLNDDGSTCTCGYAFVFVGFLLDTGRFVYLEDLYLQVEHRGGGGGKLTMKSLAALCLSLECTSLFWQALDWNTSGLMFYKKIGATIHEGEKTSRYAGEALKLFAERGTI